MICKPCGVAGDLVTYIKETETFRGDLHVYVLAARQLHKECGSTCDCAHVMPRIKPANRSVKA